MYIYTYTYICLSEIYEIDVNLMQVEYALPHRKLHLNVKTNNATHTPRKYENDCYSHNELCIKNRVRPKKREIVAVR